MKNQTNQSSQQQELSARGEHLNEQRSLTPRVDIFENNDEILLIADVPGVRKEDLNLRIEKHELSLEGNVPADPAGFHGAFRYQRSFSLPHGIDGERVSAELKQGTLTLKLPKAASLRTRQVQITQGS